MTQTRSAKRAVLTPDLVMRGTGDCKVVEMWGCGEFYASRVQPSVGNDAAECCSGFSINAGRPLCMRGRLVVFCSSRPKAPTVILY